MPSVLSGVVQDLLDNAEDTNKSKILNALDFPLWDGNGDRYAYATDVAAWDVTRGLHIFDPSVLYPAGDVRWGLAGLKNSMTFLHIDPEGFHTENTVGVGGKAWGLLRERPSLKTSSSNFYLHEGFCLNEIADNTQYDFEIVALRPGDRMYVCHSLPRFYVHDSPQIYATQYPSFCVWNGEFHLLWRALLFHYDNATDSLRPDSLIYAGQICNQHRSSGLSAAASSDPCLIPTWFDG